LIEHLITYTCDACGFKAEERYPHPAPALGHAAILRYPEIPVGWQVLQGRLICGVHRITVEVT